MTRPSARPEFGGEFGGTLLAGLGFGVWVLFIMIANAGGRTPRSIEFGLPAFFGGLACVMSVIDLWKGMWVRGFRGLVTGVALLLFTGYLWIITAQWP